MADHGGLDKLRRDYPGTVEKYLDTQDLWGYRFRISQPLGHTALEVVRQSLREQIEIEAFQLETLEDGAIPAHTVLEMLVRGVSARAANKNAYRVVAPQFGTGHTVEAPVASVHPLMPEDALTIFGRTDARIPDFDDDFADMIDPVML